MRVRILALLSGLVIAGGACAGRAPAAAPQPAPEPRPEPARAEEAESKAGPEAGGTARRLAGFLARRSGQRPEVTRRVARAVVREAERHRIEPALLTGVLLVENVRLDTTVRSRVGATGLMQVMPFHAGRYGCGGRNLRELDANVCHGARILRDYLTRTGDVRGALLRYNGCTGRRSGGPCRRYPAKVLKLAGAVRRALAIAPGGIRDDRGKSRRRSREVR